MNVQYHLFSIIFLFSFNFAVCMQAYLELAQIKLTLAEQAFNINSEKDLGDLNVIDNVKETVLGTALKNDCSLEFISFLLKRGANPLLKVGSAQVAIITACALRENLKQLNFFYDKGIRYPADDQSLHAFISHVSWACKSFGPMRKNKIPTEESYIPSLELLIKMGSPLNILNYAKQTPLCRSLMHGQVNFVKTLLDAGADPFPQIIDSASIDRIHYPVLPGQAERKAECQKLLTATKKKTFCALNRNPELYFSILPIDVMKEASNYVQ